MFFHWCGAEHLCLYGFFVMVVLLVIFLCRCVFIPARVSSRVLGTCCSFSTKMCINELRESGTVIDWNCPLVGKQHVTPRFRV